MAQLDLQPVGANGLDEFSGDGGLGGLFPARDIRHHWKSIRGRIPRRNPDLRYSADVALESLSRAHQVFIRHGRISRIGGLCTAQFYSPVLSDLRGPEAGRSIATGG